MQNFIMNYFYFGGFLTPDSPLSKSKSNDLFLSCSGYLGHPVSFHFIKLHTSMSVTSINFFNWFLLVWCI